MHKTKYGKNTTGKATWGQIWPQRGKIEILEKRLSPTAQNHYADLQDTCRDTVTKVGVIVRYIKKLSGKNEGWGRIWPQVAVWGLNQTFAKHKTRLGSCIESIHKGHHIDNFKKSQVS